jgi:uncharacterized protein
MSRASEPSVTLSRPMRTVPRPWWKVAAFLALAALLTWALPWQRIPLPGGPAWGPGLAALVVQLVFERRVSGLGWRPGAVRWLALALLLPVLYVGASYAAGRIVGVAPMRGDLAWMSDLLTEGLGLPAMPRWAQVPAYVAMMFLLVSVPGMGIVAALGEEIGWRGLLAPALFPMLGVRGAALASGALWALWHWPGLLDGAAVGELSSWYRVAMLSITLVAISVPMTWLTWRARSLWPATLFHAAHACLPGAFASLTVQDGKAAWLVGESGALTAAACVVLAVVAWRRLPRGTVRPWPPSRRSPSGFDPD